MYNPRKYNSQKNAVMLNLSRAAGTGNLDTVLAILQSNLQSYPDMLDNIDFDRTVLMIAAKSGHADIVRALLSAGANPNIVSHRIIDELDHYYTLGGTALIEATRSNHLNIVEILLSSGADPNKVGHGTATPLFYAAKNRNIEIINLLLNSAANHHLALMKAAEVGTDNYFYVVELLLDGNKINTTTLDMNCIDEVFKIAVQKFNAEIVLLLLKKFESSKSAAWLVYLNNFLNLNDADSFNEDDYIEKFLKQLVSSQNITERILLVILSNQYLIVKNLTVKILKAMVNNNHVMYSTNMLVSILNCQLLNRPEAVHIKNNIQEKLNQTKEKIIH